MSPKSNALSSRTVGTHSVKRAAPEPAPPTEMIAAHTMDGVADSLNCSVPVVYRLIAEGHLTTFRIGRRRYASPRAIRECVERLEKLGAVLPAESGGNNRAATGNSAATQG